MSLTFEELDNALINYKKLGEKVEKILGFNPVYSDHYGRFFMYGVNIDLETEDSEIIKIDNDFAIWYESIIILFDSYGLQFNSNYFTKSEFGGSLMILSKYIDIYGSNRVLDDILFDFSTMSKKIKGIGEQYGFVEDRYFSIPYKKRDSDEYYYYLYGTIVSIKSSDYNLECIIKQYQYLNTKVNYNLQICGYSGYNKIYCYEPTFGYNNNEGSYYIFSKLINNDTKEDELKKIINKAIEFEKTFEIVISELDINEKYTIKYTDNMSIYFGRWGSSFNIDMNYEKIKKKLLSMYYMFNKK